MDLGITPSPFNISYPFMEGLSKLQYKNNFKPMLGFGYAYKWLSFRLAVPIMPGFRNESKFGQSQQIAAGFDFSFKKWHLDIEFRAVQGYAIKNAFQYDSTYNESKPNEIISSVGSINFSLNGWYFNNKDFKMNALQGKRAHFNSEVQTWYLKSTLNVFGVDHNGNSIIPVAIHDPNNSKTTASTFSSFDFGLIPGYAYANRVKDWQFSGWFGLGPVVQCKFYTTAQNTAGFLGLAPRYDLKLVGGYNSKTYFLLLAADFDNKSIRFNQLKYQQYFYTIRLVGGFRLASKKAL